MKEDVLLQKTREIETMKIQLKVLMRLNEIGRMPHSLENVYEDALNLAIEIISAKYGSLILFNKDTEKLEFVSVRAKTKAAENKLKKLKLDKGEGLAGWVYLTGIPILSNSIETDVKWQKKIAEEINYKPHRIMCSPITVGADIIGVLELIDKKQNEEFSDYDMEIFRLFTEQLGIILENRQLYRGLENEITRIKDLIETSVLLSSTLDLDELLNLIMEKAKQILGAEASSIFQIDEETGELYFRVATGEKGKAAKAIKVPMGKGVVGWAAEQGETVIVPDVSKDNRFYKKVDKETKFKTKSIIAVPLMTKHGIMGVAEVLNKIEGVRFSKEDIKIFESLARQASVAIENAHLYNDLNELIKQAISSIVTAVEKKDMYTRGHTERVTKFSLMIGREMHMDSTTLHNLELAALLHDVGKIGIPDNILLKKGKLTDEEYSEIKKHPHKGIEIIGHIKQLKPITDGILYHHEHFDGSGYPAGLKSDSIPLLARVISVADAYDAMTTDRPYRNALDQAEAIRRLKEASGTQFDPTMVDYMLNILK